MSEMKGFLYNKFLQNKRNKILLKEAFRKFIHIMSAFIPLFAYFTSSNIVIFALSCLVFLYSIFEMFRLKGKRFCFTRIVEIANRKRDENRFSLGPVTLALGIIITLYFFPLNIASMAIFSLSFGDGFASLIGKAYGSRKFIFEGKTYAGSIACFVATCITQLALTHNFFISFAISCITCLVEALPLKDFDNVLIPLTVAISVKLFFY